MSEITIPEEAVEAAAFHLPGYHSKDLHAHVRAAIRAALEAWPNGEKVYRSEDEKLFTILLPMPQEKQS